MPVLLGCGASALAPKDSALRLRWAVSLLNLSLFALRGSGAESRPRADWSSPLEDQQRDVVLDLTRSAPVP